MKVKSIFYFSIYKLAYPNFVRVHRTNHLHQSNLCYSISLEHISFFQFRDFTENYSIEIKRTKYRFKSLLCHLFSKVLNFLNLFPNL